MARATGLQPRVSRGLAVVPTDEGLVVDGGPERCLFRGRAAAELLPRLMSALDGTRSERQVCAETGVTQAQLAQVVELLDRYGLVESWQLPRCLPAPSAEIDAHLSRVVGCGGQYAAVAEILDVLAATTVHLVGRPEVATRIRDDLAGCGVEGVTVGSTPQDRLDPRAGRVLVVVVDDVTGQPLRSAVDWCRQHRVGALRVAAAGGAVEIGPWFPDGAGPCHGCVHRGRADAGWSGPDDVDGTTADLLAALAADAVVAIAARLPQMPAPASMTRTVKGAWTKERLLATAYPQCAECAAAREPCDDRTDLVELYHRQVSTGPAEVTPLPNESTAWLSNTAEMQSKRTSYPGHPWTRVPAPTRAVEGRFGAGVSASHHVDQATLATLMCLVAGTREPDARDHDRWAPTGGNLGSVEAYLVTADGVPGLPGTIFRYDDLGHGYLAVRPDGWTVGEVLWSTDLHPDPADAAVVLVAAHGRVAAKYGEFTYHLAHLDAGCAATQLAAVGAGLGLAVDFASSWDERLAEALCLDPEYQYVTAVATVRRGPREAP